MKSITTINIKLPFWLEWTRRFIVIEMKKHKLPKLKGRETDIIILDEADYYDNNK